MLPLKISLKKLCNNNKGAKIIFNACFEGGTGAKID
jgi:hypothetical protein